jgi:hypothetical protein
LSSGNDPFQDQASISDRADILADVCGALASSDVEAASKTLRDRYPFEPLASKRSSSGQLRSMKLFRRDGFVDRYSGQRLVFPGAMLVMSKFLPQDFPCHPNWRTDATHFAYYELWPVLDHVIPVTIGGGSGDDNLVTTSAIRNADKANFTVDELGWTLRSPPADQNWDGLTVWFLQMTSDHPDLLSDKSLGRWHQAAVAARGQSD